MLTRCIEKHIHPILVPTGLVVISFTIELSVFKMSCHCLGLTPRILYSLQDFLCGLQEIPNYSHLILTVSDEISFITEINIHDENVFRILP